MALASPRGASFPKPSNRFRCLLQEGPGFCAAGNEKRDMDATPVQLLRPGHHGTSECGLNTSSIGLVGGVAGWSWQAATPAFGRSARPKATSLQKLAEKGTRALKLTLSETWPRRLISLQAPTPSLLRAEGSERTPKHEELFRFSLSLSFSSLSLLSLLRCHTWALTQPLTLLDCHFPSSFPPLSPVGRAPPRKSAFASDSGPLGMGN